MNPASTSATLEAQLLHLNSRTLSTRARYGHVALLLAASAMGVLLAALLATEPAMPGRTRAAMAVMLAVAACWCGYACWVLAARRPLLARHRVVAGGMAVAFTGLFVLATSALAWTTRLPGFLLAAGLGVAMLAVAIGLLVRARHHRDRLRTLQRDLERQLEAAR